MRITNKDLEFLVELENYLGAKESWSPMVSKLWELNERLINHRIGCNERRHVRRHSDPVDRLLKSIAMCSDELDRDTIRQIDGESTEEIEEIVNDIIRTVQRLYSLQESPSVCEEALTDTDDDKTSHTNIKPKYSVKIKLRKRGQHK